MAIKANERALGAFGVSNPNPGLSAAGIASKSRNPQHPPKPSVYVPPVKWLQEGESLAGRIVSADFVWQEQWQKWQMEVAFDCGGQVVRTNRSSYCNQLHAQLGAKYQEWVNVEVEFEKGELVKLNE